MAFSTEQKKQLSLMVDLPQEFLKKIESNEVYLPVFRNQFFKDGTGIFHLLAECIVTREDNSEYFEIMNKLLEKESNLYLFQQTGRKPSAFPILTDYAKENSWINNDIVKWLTKIQIHTNEYNSDKYYVSEFIYLLAEKNDIKNIEVLLQSFPDFPKESSFIKRLLEICIEQNHEELLDLILTDDRMLVVLNEKIGQFKFNTNKKYFDPTYVNAYSFGVKKEAKEVTIKLLSKFQDKINIDGTVIQSGFTYKNSNIVIKHPLDDLLDRNFNLNDTDKDFFISFYKQLSLVEKTKWLASNNNRINALYSKGLEFLALENLENIFKSEKIENIFKLKIFNLLMHYDNFKGELEDRDKYQTIEKITAPLWKYLPKVGNNTNFVSSHFLFNSFNSNGDMREEERESFSNIVENLIKYEHIDYMPSMFGLSFFNEPKLVKKLIDKGLNLERLINHQYLGSSELYDFNIFELYLNVEKQQRNNSDKNRKYTLQEEKVIETLQLIHNYNPNLIFKNCVATKEKENICILENAVSDTNEKIFKLLTKTELKKFIINGFESDIVTKLSEYLRAGNEAKHKYNYIVEKLFDAGYDLNIDGKYNIPVYFNFFDRLSSFELLDEILNRFNINLSVVAENSEFWTKINTENSISFLKSKLINPLDEIKAKRILEVLSSSDTFQGNLSLFLEIYPQTINLKLSEGDNILHKAIKNEAYNNAREIIRKFPDLGVAVNKQHKMPVSYFIAKFAKDVDRANKKEWTALKINAERHKELFREIIGIGLFSDDKKANKILDEQLSKYFIIEESFPEVIKEYNYHKLSKSLPSESKIINKKLKI